MVTLKWILTERFGYLLKSLYYIVMGLLDKTRSQQPAVPLDLSKEELKFILTKLRTADYKGTEFEAFFNVYSKIQDQLDKLK